MIIRRSKQWMILYPLTNIKLQANIQGISLLNYTKKNDPENQSIWNTDDTRLTYLIKELVNNKSSNWMVDRKGHKTTTYIIKPLLARIKEMLMEYHLTYGIPKVTCNSVEMEFMLDNSKKIMEIINDIDDGVTSKDILKHISSYLKFNIKSIKQYKQQKVT